MFNVYRPGPRPDVCIICGERPGTISTADGYVCGRCMPRDLLPEAGSLPKYRIMVYRNTFRDRISCQGDGCSRTCGPIEDRSAAITQATPSKLVDELNDQIRTAESIDIVVSFIKMSGLSLIYEGLADFTAHGRLRVITTQYMGATEYEALADLFRLPNTEVRMELDAARTRLHAKTFIFGRPDGNGTAFVGSANISKTALTYGEEWVVKLLERDVPRVLCDLRDSYEVLWNSPHTKPVSAKDRAEIEFALECRGK